MKNLYMRVAFLLCGFAILSSLLQAAEPEEGLVGYWALNEGSGRVAYDGSSSGNHGAVVGRRPLWVEGAPGRGLALGFNGDTYIDIPHHLSYNFTSQMTVAAWIRVTAFDCDWQAIVTKGDSAWRLHRYAAFPSASFDGTGLSGDGAVHGQIAVDDGQWHHVAGTYNGATMRIYVDGVQDSYARRSGAIALNACNVMIGANAEARDRTWRGAIDEVRLYSRALSGEEIALLASRPEVIQPGYLPEDLDHDGRVNLLDLARLARTWMDCTTPTDPGCQPRPADFLLIDSVQETAAANLTPVYMYYLERYLRGAPNPTAADLAFAEAFDGLGEGMDPFLTALDRYRNMPYEAKHALFDATLLQETARLYQPLNVNLIQERIKSIGSVVAQQPKTAPAAPSGLEATNISSFEPTQYAIALAWQDNSFDEDGFLVYRAAHDDLPEGTFQPIGLVGAGVSTYTDILKQPPAVDDMYCYQVTAYRNNLISVAGQSAGRVESAPTDAVCAYYAVGYPYTPLPDMDTDGISDDQDQCPGIPGVWPHGCPDKDGDGVPDHQDYCETEYATEDPANPGCPLRYTLRWMGMKILNNTGSYVYSSKYVFTDDEGRTLYNETDDYLDFGEEPYLLFSFVNGMTAKGMKETGTIRWSSGERVNVKQGLDFEPDLDSSLEEFPMNLAALRSHGLAVFPAVDGYFAPIDGDMELIMTVTLMERDDTLTIYPEEASDTMGALFKSGGAVAGAVSTCVGTGGFGCLMSIGGALKSLIDSIFDLSAPSPDPVVVKDEDDYMGTEVWMITRTEARFKTEADGTYGFWFDTPTTYLKSCLGWEPCYAGWGVPITMRARLYFCLHREDVPTSYIQQKYSTPEQKAAAYQMVLPWPMVQAP